VERVGLDAPVDVFGGGWTCGGCEGLGAGELAGEVGVRVLGGWWGLIQFHDGSELIRVKCWNVQPWVKNLPSDRYSVASGRDKDLFT